jgi:hypothetical protein
MIKKIEIILNEVKKNIFTVLCNHFDEHGSNRIQ